MEDWSQFVKSLFGDRSRDFRSYLPLAPLVEFFPISEMEDRLQFVKSLVGDRSRDFGSYPTSLETFTISLLHLDPTEVVLKCVFELKEYISDVLKIKIHLTPGLKRMLEILESIHSALTQMSSVDLKLDLPIADIYDFLSVLREAGELVRQCNRQGRVVEAERTKKLKDSIYNFYCVSLRNQLMKNLRMSGQLSEKKDHHKKFHGMVVGPRHPVEELKLLLEEDGWPLVITGPPGYGKTTLVQNLCQDPAIKDKYGDNIFLYVPETPNVADLLRKLYEDMNLRQYVPSGTLDLRELEISIKNSEISHMLLILDDVRGEWEFLIDTFNFRIPGYKLLITSRFRFPRFDGYELTRLCENDGQPLYFQKGKRHLDPNNHQHVNKVAEVPLLMWERRAKNNSGEVKPVYVENLEGMTKSVALFDMFEMDDSDANVVPSNYLESRAVGDSSAQE